MSISLSPSIAVPDEWVSGDEPMTGAQASYLKTLSEKAKDSNAFDEKLTKAEASEHIDARKAKVQRELTSRQDSSESIFDNAKGAVG